MSKETRSILLSVDNIIRQRSPRWIQPGQIPDPLRHFVVSTGGITTDPKTADNLAAFVERHPAAERDDSACDLPIATAGPCWWGKKAGVQQV